MRVSRAKSGKIRRGCATSRCPLMTRGCANSRCPLYVVSMTCGMIYRHTVHRRWLASVAKMISPEHGSVWSMGDGYLGCLGHGDWAPRLVLEMIDEAHLPESWSVSAGWAHSASISVDGEVMLWGRMRVRGVFIYLDSLFWEHNVAGWTHRHRRCAWQV